MKNILKKIGIIAIIVGVLSPFITLPRVNAATEECKYYLNQYLFLDTFKGSQIGIYESENDYIGKRNFTSFIYTFEKPVQGERIEITDYGNVNLSRESELKEYFDAYQKFYEDSTIKQRKDIAKFGAWVENVEKYESITTLVHGKWAADEDRKATITSWPEFKTFDDFRYQTIQQNVGDNQVLFSTKLGGATLEKYSNKEIFGIAHNNYSKDIELFLTQIIEDYNANSTNTTSYTNNYLFNENNQTYFNLNILREIDKSDLDKISYGFNDGENKVLSTSETSIRNSYDALINYNENGDNCDGSNPCYFVSGHYDIDITEQYYWPALYNIGYKVCKTTSSWTLTYDRGVSAEEVVNVTNMPEPNPVAGLINKNVTLSVKKPERKNYAFKSWCTEKDGKGTCIEAGKEFINEKMEDKTLYAYWVKPGTENNEKQGVISYVIGFVGVGLVAYGLYYVINKKNLFKQI